MASTVNSGGRRWCLLRYTALTIRPHLQSIIVCASVPVTMPRVLFSTLLLSSNVYQVEGGGVQRLSRSVPHPTFLFRVPSPPPVIAVCACCLPTIAAGCFTGIVSALNRLGKVVVYDTEFNSGDYLREKVADVVKDAMRRLSPPQG
jgi:hypothetical protein